MSKAIQESLDLPILEDLLRPKRDDVEDSVDDVDDTEDFIDTVESSIVASPESPVDVRDHTQSKDHEDSTDEIYTEAFQHAKDLMDLGYNVDTRSAPKIFDSAANMLKIALDAKNSKREAQLKFQKLVIERQKQSLAERIAKGQGGGDNEIEGESVIVEDRNELLKLLRNSK